MAGSRIYLSPPDLSGRELALVEDAIRSNWIAPLGPHVEAFEREFAATVGVPQAAALASGTAALHLAMVLLEVGRGDTVIVPTLTFAASANVAAYQGAEPRFVDCAPATWTLDPDLVDEELAACARAGRRPRAVIAVDLYGQCCDYPRLEAVCERHGVALVEDAAEALGASCGGRPAGAFGRLAAFSFNGNKIITTSGGGMLVARDAALVEQARFLASQAKDPAPHYQHSRLGYNYRLSNLLAALGRGQLELLAERVAARRARFAAYVAALGDLPGLEFMPEAGYGRASRWLTCLTIDPERFGASRDDVRVALERERIESRPLWKPMHLQPLYAGSSVRGGQVAECLFERGLCLPSGSSLAAADFRRIVAVVRRTARP